MKKEHVIIDFKDAISEKLLDPDIREGISSIACTGKYLWVAGDENISIQRLERLEDGSYGKARTFFLENFFDLPAPGEEADIEGMDVDGNYLWIVGSHSYKRKKIRTEKENSKKEVDRLSKTKLGPNRNLLARIPLVQNSEGEFTLVKSYPDPTDPGRKLTAAKLKHSKRKWSQLTKKLRKDKHIGSFITIPGKDNGFDIEGLAVFENRLFIGLRGPVLRGWAVILEMELEEEEPHLLKLKKDNESGRFYRKHFVDLHGMGIRELVTAGKDLLILAGPSMDLDGTMEVYRWKNGIRNTTTQLISRGEIESLFVFPYHKEKHGIDKAEGLAISEAGNLLIAYDSPDDDRKFMDHQVALDLVSLR